MKNRILILLLIIPCIFLLSFLLPTREPKVKKWTYNLPNDYVAGKVGVDKVIIGEYVNNKLDVKKDGKTIGLSEYVEAFAYNDKYIYARCLTSENYLTINYYIIDSEEEKIYGSYELEGFLDKLKELELSDEIDWLESADFDK